MAKLVILITGRDDEAHNIGEAWRQAGAPGVTVIEGYGLQQLKEQSTEILPGMMSMFDILRRNDPTSIIMLALIENDGIIDRIEEATQHILGDLRDPNNGIFFVLNVERAVGIRDHAPSQ
jgi:nitrogen regulatory protein PII